MPRIARLFCLAVVGLILIAVTSSRPGSAESSSVPVRHGNPQVNLMPGAASLLGVTYETVHHIPIGPCSPSPTFAGLGYDPQNRPVLGWAESSSCGGAIPFRWSRHESSGWSENTMSEYFIRATQPDLELRSDGTPFYAFSVKAYYIFGQDWYAAQVVDLNANPTGPGVNSQPIEAGTSCISAYPKFAMDFAPGDTSPNLLIGTHCQYSGWLALNNASVHGNVPFRVPAGTEGEFHSIDYATAPNGSHHLTYYSERGGSNWGAYYSNGSPGHELLLATPHRNRQAETSIAVGPDGRIHVAIGGVPLCNNTFEGGLLYLTSMDGVNWTRTFVDDTSGRNPSIALDAQGQPRIAYWRHKTEVRLAALEGATWNTSPIYVANAPVGLTSVKLAYDTSGQPHVAFFNPDTGDITISSGVHSNFPPDVANPGAQTSAAGAVESLQIAAIDSESGLLSYSACNLPPGLSINPNTGLITGTVTPGTPAGSYQVTVTVTDDVGNTGSVTFDWAIAENRAPILVNPGNQTDAEGDAISLPLTATDPDGDSLSFSGSNLPPGIAIVPGTGLITGTLTYASAGTYAVSVSVTDGPFSDTELFTWTVTDVNRAPVADSNSASTPEDTSVQITLSASDADGDTLAYSIVGNPSNGVVTLLNGIVTYDPNSNFNGADSFSFKVNDGTADSNTATISLLVTPVNDGPTAQDDLAVTAEDNPLVINVLTNDNDADGETLSVASASNGSHGTVTVNGNGSVTYAPSSNFNGTDSFTYQADDGHGDIASATVSITVTPVNDAPSATGDSASTSEDSAVTVVVLTSDFDLDGDPLSVTAVTQAGHGLVTINPDSTLTYTPEANFFGVDTFNYTLGDGHGATSSAEVAINVTPVNDAPTASDGVAIVNEDGQVEITLVGADIDSSSLTFAVIDGTLNGTLSAVVGNKVVYIPNSNYNGTDAFTFKANDGSLDSNLACIAINVTPVADPPTLSPVGSFTIPAGTLLSFSLSASDPDGGVLAFSAIGLPSGATLNSITGAFAWTPASAQAGSYSVTFTVTDPSGLSASQSAMITVTDTTANLGPVCAAAYPDIREIWPPNHKRTEVIEILGVTDPENDPLSLRVLSILQDEPTDTLGDGTTWIDGGGVDSPKAWVRAERSGTSKVPGNGRVYEIFFEVSDGRQACTGSVKVGVPHDQGKGPAQDDGVRFDSTVAGGPCLNCNP
ncbi:MAG TPA: Ig-like domain-containing protein [Pyrinomonadaceae bacterium]|nr:Ig-like domain-containing protein [Pyrinomonadaceae bacterium]